MKVAPNADEAMDDAKAVMAPDFGAEAEVIGLISRFSTFELFCCCGLLTLFIDNKVPWLKSVRCVEICGKLIFC